jgi:hypothetical protein
VGGDRALREIADLAQRHANGELSAAEFSDRVRRVVGANTAS